MRKLQILSAATLVVIGTALIGTASAGTAPLADAGVGSDMVQTVALKPTLDATRMVLSREIWDLYKAKFITAEGRIVDNDNGDVSHSEGQGYGLLLAAFADDQETFQRVWRWTAKELYIRNDNLAAWRWKPNETPHVQDRNNASDGDLLIAWALAEAATRWKVPEYRANAHKIALDVGRLATSSNSIGRIISPGVNGFGAKDMKDGPVVNLSYWVFPAIDFLKSVAPEIDWVSIKQSGLKLLKATSTGPSRLPPDWLSLADNTVAPAKNFPARFSYDAIRIPLYLAWGGTIDRETLGVFNQTWSSLPDSRPNVVDVSNGQAAESLSDPGYQAVVALTRCATEGVKFPVELMNVKPEHYYPATLQILSLLIAGNRYSKCF